MNKTKLILALFAALLISACEKDTSTELQDSIVETTPETDGAVNPSALFDPSNGVIPFPNNLLFGGTTDLTLNIPVADANDLSDPQVALNALDGFSTVAPMSVGFSTAIDAATITTGVKVYEVTLSGPGGAVVAINSELTYGLDYFATLSSVDSSQSTLAILPINQPLDESTSYMVVITDDMMTSDGRAFGPSVTYRLIKTLTDPLVPCASPTDPACTLPGALRSLTTEELASFESMRLIINTSEATVAAFDSSFDTSDIILSWSFTTQSIGEVLEEERGDITAGAVPTSFLVDSGADSALAAADIYVGSLEVPYYLATASSANDPSPLASYWQGAGGSALVPGNYDAEPTIANHAIPLMVSVPKSAMPGSGYPVVIYQHGITTNRATMLAVADSMAAAGIAVVAIDMPMHGLTGNETDGTENFYQAAGVSERTFDLDLVDNATSAPGPDGVTDTSGTHFINLSNLLNTRDNLRQAVSDLFTLTHAISGLSAPDATGAGGIGFDASFNSARIYFLGHSLGAMVGTTYMAMEPDVRDAALAFGGGSLPKILDGSAAFSPTMVAGLAANGVNKGTADYESFLGAAQTVVDTVDPINHAEDASNVSGRGIVFFEIVGGPTSPSDLVVPNEVPDGNDSGSTVAAPLAGTEPMLDLMGLNPGVNTDQGAPAGPAVQHSVKFVVGSHSSLLSADADAYNDATTMTAVRTEIQTIASTFLATDGSFIDITDNSLLQ